MTISRSPCTTSCTSFITNLSIRHSFQSIAPFPSLKNGVEWKRDCYYLGQMNNHKRATITISANSSPSSEQELPALRKGLSTRNIVAHPVKCEFDPPLPANFPDSSTFIRLGPHVFDDNDLYHSDGERFRVGHWFDGLASIQLFRLNKDTNTLQYESKSLSDHIKRNISRVSSHEWNEITFGTTTSPKANRLKLLLQPRVKDVKTNKPLLPNINVTMTEVPGRDMCVRTDFVMHLPLDDEFNPKDADQWFSFEDIDPRLKGMGSCAHGFKDNTTNEFYNFVANGQKYQVFKILPGGKNVQILASFNSHPSYIHSFAVTQNYIVFMVYPLHWNPIKMLWTRTFSEGFSFKQDEKTQIYIICKNGKGIIKQLEYDSFFCFHQINAYEDDDTDEIIMDLCKFKDDRIIYDLSLTNLKSSHAMVQGNTYSRFKISLANDTISEQIIYDKYFELPQINLAFLAKKYQYAYGVSSFHGQLFDSLTKVDTVAKSSVVWPKEKKNIAVGEPIFIPDLSQSSQNEDDGWIVSVVVDGPSSKVVILDAKSMTCVSQAQLPAGVIAPLCFHGWIKVDDDDWPKYNDR